ncbi:sporulation membrane protein YtaF [Gracilibacillus caseinilyticus]|uniref:Sporulation membrane protein YtaF n=1 Tax=Gracilibacillus caseinilyticus TaxID=2932256 RepID=A0ABY4ESX7_9BACI|nr:sporulation membrane protein YtaF [Gracilibacillus caseinilyticus]UOQ47176.1 sporulation membrane protein YtaF [Gracilibacillus caseinilyticus]
MMLPLLLFAISMDSVLVAFTYGLRGLTLPAKELVKISFTVAVFFGISMGFGSVLASFISINLMELAGGFILTIVGLCLIVSLLQKESEKKIPFPIKILKKPMEADIDRSGNINGMEPFLIGVALSLDSFGAGIGIYLLGASPIFTPILVGFITAFCLFVGVYTGKYFANSKGLGKMSFLPGCLLVIIGIWKMIVV